MASPTAVSVDAILERAAAPHILDLVAPPPARVTCDGIVLDDANYVSLLGRVRASGVSTAVQIGLVVDSTRYAAALLTPEKDEDEVPSIEMVHAALLWTQLGYDLLNSSEAARTCPELKEWVGSLHTVSYPAIADHAIRLAKTCVTTDPALTLECVRVARTADDSSTRIGFYGWHDA